jgi:hypothetical protein
MAREKDPTAKMMPKRGVTKTAQMPKATRENTRNIFPWEATPLKRTIRGPKRKGESLDRTFYSQEGRVYKPRRGGEAGRKPSGMAIAWELRTGEKWRPSGRQYTHQTSPRWVQQQKDAARIRRGKSATTARKKNNGRT